MNHSSEAVAISHGSTGPGKGRLMPTGYSCLARRGRDEGTIQEKEEPTI